MWCWRGAPGGGLGKEFPAIQPEYRQQWKEAKLERWSKFEAETVRNYVRAWQAWVKWCAAKGLDALGVQAHAQEFLFAPNQRGKKSGVAPSEPRS